MKITRYAGRRVVTVVAAIGAAIAIPAVALAAPGHAAHPARGARTASAPRCTASQLSVWVGVPGDASAGAVHYQLELSNISHQTCTLFGFPGVSAYGPGGHQLGSAAARVHSHPSVLITIGRGATAHVELGVTDVGVFAPSACHPVTAAGLRVFAPNNFRSEQVPLSFRACSKRGPIFLHVSATIAGTGVPGFST